MKKLLLLTCAIGCTLFAKAKDLTQYVNPLMGSQSSYELSSGNTYPAIARPWGMNFWTPQTGKMGDGWQYTYTANKIRGIKQTHQPSPWINDYGQFSLMPVVGNPEFNEEKRASWFSHKAEEARPNYYKVYLADHDVVAEVTPTERAAMFRFTFPENKDSYIVVDAFDRGSHIQVLPGQNRIIGYSTRNSGGVPDNFKNYFVVEFDKPFTYQATFADSTLTENLLLQTANHAGAVIGFQTRKGEVVHARVASSFISPEQALLNLNELGNDSFDAVKEKGKTAWNDALGRIEVDGGNLDQYRTFYSCLYRSLLFPRKFYEFDANGQPIHYSPYNGQVLPGYMYTDTGFWDTFRCLFPFLNLMYPTINHEIQEGLVNTYKESGFFPEWASPGHRGCMIGNNSASVLVDAYLKGVKVDDVETLYKGLIHGTNNVHPEVSSTGREGYEYYNKLGYVPYDVKINENTARTLEYAYNDWCIYQLAKKLNRPKKEREIFAKRAMNYRNVFDKESSLMRGRNLDGTFITPFSPLKWGDAFTEGNSWHYSWSVFHDPQGLINLMGGEQKFIHMLDSVFAVPPVFDESYYGQVIHEIREMQIMNMGNYAHGNQPIQHMIYLYNYAGQPWKAQYWLRQVMNRMYTPAPDG
ncbi:MAG: GH92 family glycosyl hydrolase, partial [Bacteroides sp.]|nr:GH92 family glycosyl hydrolase [Bacteroides sp.]